MKKFFKSALSVDDIVSELKETIATLRAHEEVKAEEVVEAYDRYQKALVEQGRAARIATNLEELLK